jgi:hypothetical protein
MAVNTSQPEIMCPGQKARYVCAAPGINVREDDITNSAMEINCKADLQYNTPTQWPQCVDKLDCSNPPIDTGVMEYDWVLADDGVTPPYSVKYVYMFF